MVEQLVVAIVPSVITIVLTVLGGVLTKWLAAKGYGAKFATGVSLAREVVNAVEMVAAKYGWSSVQKKAQAVEWLAGAVKLSPSTIDLLIESAVKELKSWGAELGPDGKPKPV